MRPNRQHPRRKGLMGRHAAPEPLVTEPSLSVSRETSEELDRAEAARLELLAVVDEAPPPLSRERIAKLEAATAKWMREVRLGGPGPDDTLLYAAPKPPPPVAPRRPAGSPEPEPYSLAAADELVHALADEVLPPRTIRDWSSRHDPRSLEFDVKARLAARVPLQDRLWPIGPVFDQGTTPPLSLREASGCVGMASAAAANVLALAAGRSDLLTKDDALALYERAQDLDHVSGHDYPGTSVLAGMKAGQEAGHWDAYLWAFGTRDIAQALLQVGPVVIGVPWTTGLEEPGPGGVVTPGGAPAGGHALCLVGLLTSRPGGPWFVAQQSRGPAEGDRGRILIHHKVLSGLLAGIGEAAIPIRSSVVR